LSVLNLSIVAVQQNTYYRGYPTTEYTNMYRTFDGIEAVARIDEEDIDSTNDNHQQN